MNLKECLLEKNACYIKGERITPAGIMVHSTGANNHRISRYVQPNDGLLGVNKYGNHWNTYAPDGRLICPHAFIGLLEDMKTVATYQTLPFNFKGWHSGKGSEGSANDLGYIGFEICEDGLDDPVYFEAVYREAKEFCAFLCSRFELDPFSRIIDHAEGHALGYASNHGDVSHWFEKFGKTMDNFRSDVFGFMQGAELPPSERKTFKVKLGRFVYKEHAQRLLKELKAKGYGCFIARRKGFYAVQVGAFSEGRNAQSMAEKFKGMGYQTYIDYE